MHLPLHDLQYPLLRSAAGLLLLHQKRKILQLYTEVTSSVLLFVGLEGHQFQELATRTRMAVFQGFQGGFELVQGEPAVFEEVQLEDIQALCQTKSQEDDCKQVLEFYERLGKKLVLGARKVRMERHLHIALQVMKGASAGQSLQWLKELIHPSFARRPQIRQSLLGQLASRTPFVQIHQRTSLLLSDFPQRPSISHSLIVSSPLRIFLLSDGDTPGPSKQVNHVIPLQKRKATDHLPHKIQHLPISPPLLIPFIHHILKRILMVLEQRMQFEEVRAYAEIILHPEMAKRDEVTIIQGLSCLHLLANQLRVELED